MVYVDPRRCCFRRAGLVVFDQQFIPNSVLVLGTMKPLHGKALGPLGLGRQYIQAVFA